MRDCEIRGKELLDANVLTAADLYEWLRGKNVNEASIVGVGLPCYSLLQTLLFSIKANSSGVLLLDDFEITHFNRPKDKLLDWFFNPVMVLKEQIRVIKLVEGEVRYLEKVVLFGVNKQRLKTWDNGSLLIPDGLRAAQIEGISRRYYYSNLYMLCFSVFMYVWINSLIKHLSYKHTPKWWYPFPEPAYAEALVHQTALSLWSKHLPYKHI